MKILITLALFLISQVSVCQIPNLNTQSTKTDKPLQVSSLTLNIEVVGNIATTTYDMVFFNPNSRDLEGELSMPLGDGKEIYRYALEVNGKLREGVVVEKVKARQTFEAVVRQKIDPGIVNRTKGNFFKTKIYPIPANGSKRVVLGLVETLSGDEKNLYYSMAVEASQKIGQFTLDVNVVKGQSMSVSPVSEFENLNFDILEDVYHLNFQRRDYSLSGPLKFTVPRFTKSSYQVFTEEFDGMTYFYLTAKAPLMESELKTRPRNIVIYWDRSHSASKRNMSKELELLSNYLIGLQGTKNVTFIGFNHVESAPTLFKIANDPTVLIEHIMKLKNDGATRIDNINFNKKCDKILLFSDAVNTIGDASFESSAVPVYSIVSSFGANYNLLKRTSNLSKGAFIDLNQNSTERALEMMSVNEEKLTSIDYDLKEIDKVYPDSPTRVDGFIEVVGVLKTGNSKLTINYGHQGKSTQSQTFDIRKTSNTSVSRIWANKKIESLMWDYLKNQKEILELGKKFNIVTRNSSLLVLDRIEDYVAHEIVPPVELKEAYNKLMALKKKDEETPFKVIQENNIKRANKLQRWYDEPPTKYQTKKSIQQYPNIVEVADDAEITEEIEVDLDMEVMEETVIEDIVFEEAPEEEIDAGFGTADSENEWRPNNSATNLPNALQGRVAGVEIAVGTTGSRPAEEKSDRSSIKVLAWLPDAPYMIELRKAYENNLDEVYYKLKKENANRPSFYIQVADLYFERNRNDMAVQVLSNTIELDLENPELLKVVGKRLLDEREYELATLIFEEIKKLRPEEPQSHRDLALAYVANEQSQKAFDAYQHILNNEWGRFEEIKDVILIELSGLISKYENELDLRTIKKDFVNPMPLDVRITIDWSSNDNDIDLWVVDPNGEKCFYSNPNTVLGGKISKDFTQGYGPEEYSLKSAERGTYTVYVNYYSESRQTITGPVTVYATLFTNYGTKQQASKRIAIQLANNKETKQIGQLEFEN